MSSNALYTPSPGSALPASLTVAGTAETQILNNALPTPAPLTLFIPASSILDGKVWSGTIAGVIASLGAVGTVNVKVYVGNSSTIGSNTAIAATGAAAQAVLTAPFLLKIENAIFDSGTGKLCGMYKALINNVVIAEAAFSAIVTGLSDQNNPVLALSLTVTFGVANAGNKITINQFEVDW